MYCIKYMYCTCTNMHVRELVDSGLACRPSQWTSYRSVQMLAAVAISPRGHRRNYKYMYKLRSFFATKKANLENMKDWTMDVSGFAGTSTSSVHQLNLTDTEPLNCSNLSDTETESNCNVTDCDPLEVSKFSSVTDTEPVFWSGSEDSFSSEGSFSELNSSTPSKPSSSNAVLELQVSPVGSHFLPGSKRCQREPIEILLDKCCENKCLKTLSLLDVELCLLEVQDLGSTQQRQFIVDNIRDKCQFLQNQDGKRLVKSRFLVHGKPVCEKAWCLAYGFTYRRYLKCVKMVEEGIKQVIHGNSNRQRMNEKTTQALGWMKFLFGRIGDWLPHKSAVHLPPSYTKKSLYNRMVEEFCERGVQQVNIISYEYFTTIWADHLANFVIAKRSEFTECTTCTTLKERRGRALTDVEQKLVTDLMKQHASTVEHERRAYHTARERARCHPTDQTTIIIDGMDQSKTDVPHLIRRDKATVHLSRLPVHITGVLMHTATAEGRIPLVYLDHKEVPHDSNLTLHCLLQTLMRHQEKLGKTLFLQLDNCFRENKNRYVIGFAALLVELDIFEEVTMHFLPVGHTHEDVDQLFSCISSKIQRTNIYTLDDLEKTVRDSYTPIITLCPATPLLDVKTWLEPHLFGDYHHHSHPHWFKFSKVDGVCRMHWRIWVTTPWEPQQEPDSDNDEMDFHKGLRCLHSIPDLNSPPSWVQPCLEKVNLSALTKDILQSEGYKLRLPDCARSWWEKFLAKMKDLEKVPVSPTTWPVVQLKGSCSHIHQPVPLDLEEMQTAMAKEYPKVTIGHQGKVRERNVTLEATRSSIEEGQLVALHLDDRAKRPYIGKVMKINGETIEVQWFKGSWLKPWAEINLGVGKNRRPYTDKLPVESVILWGFSLTTRSCLNSATRTELRAKYAELDEKHMH
ncbi:uncharacterized protein LOC110984676 isoform X3 [Acanthaster planci]|uniref:Uncharacterized protein LOC110984676 isoform X3 n=1 Tax=Acanthaster planci TaxID=133434 RepID=A0A8B7Z7J7_ACAPL|nr:uncharacterized protein LOC110984676 isoform X3 [Acanthaster planci]